MLSRRLAEFYHFHERDERFDPIPQPHTILETDGIIREEICSSHTHIEWELHYERTRDHVPKKISPAFKVRNQKCMLSLIYDRDHMRVHFNRMGHCGTGYVGFYAGMKRGDGSLDPHTILSTKIDFKKNYTWYCMASELYSFPRSELERDYVRPDGRMVLFLRWNVKRVRTREHRCSHGDDDLALHSVGRIREEECLAHKYVEWNISYRSLRQYATSPVFKFGNQTYLLHLSCTEDCISSSLYRIGPSVVCSARWCAGLKLGDGTYSHRSLSGKIGLRKSCELWKKTTLCDDFPRYILERQYLSPDRCLTFFFRINAMPRELEEETCTHYIQDMSTLAVGSITEEEGALYRKVEWDVDYKPEYETPSPVFVVSKQRCLFELKWSHTEKVTLSLYRMGPPAPESIRWWVGVNSSSATNHHFGSRCGELTKEAGDSWIYKTLLVFNKKPGRMRLKVGFLLSLDSDPTIDDNSQGLQDIMPLRDQLIVFKVKDKEFTFSKAILSIRAPVLETFFLHDSLENRTGVVHIEDCEPSIFEALLEFAESGNSKAITLYNVFALYVIADKYLFDHLKAMCSLTIEYSMSRHIITDAICLALRYDDDDLLECTRDFMSAVGSFHHTEIWNEFFAEYPDIVNDERLNAYRSFEIYKEECKWWKAPSEPARNWFFRIFSGWFLRGF